MHGFAGRRQDWTPIAGPLAPHVRVITVDLPGHGESDASSQLTFDGVADTLVAVADHFEVDAPIWVGYSLGARLLLPLALRHPRRVGGLILESPRAGLSDPAERARRKEQDEADAHLLETQGMRPFLQAWHARSAFDSRRTRPDWASHVEMRAKTNRADALAQCLRALGTGSMPDFTRRLTTINVPALVVAGARDAAYAAEAQRIAQRLPRAQLAILAEVGHAPHEEAPDAYLHLVQDFLSRHTLVPAPTRGIA